MNKGRQILSCLRYYVKAYQLTISPPTFTTRKFDTELLAKQLSTIANDSPENGESVKDTADVKEGEGKQPASVTKSRLLDRHLPPVDIDMDRNSDDSEDEYQAAQDTDAEDEMKRSGVYISKGIAVYVPDKCMVPGTKRSRIRTLPKDMFDDIRMIYFK